MPGCIYNLMDFKITQIKQTLIYIQILFVCYTYRNTKQKGKKNIYSHPSINAVSLEFWECIGSKYQIVLLINKKGSLH